MVFDATGTTKIDMDVEFLKAWDFLGWNG